MRDSECSPIYRSDSACRAAAGKMHACCFKMLDLDDASLFRDSACLATASYLLFMMLNKREKHV